MLIPPWIIAELEEERRREQARQPSIELPLEEARESTPRTTPDDCRGVSIIDISPENPAAIRI